MPMTLDTHRIRRCTFPQLSAYFKELDHTKKEDVTRQLLDAIDCGSIAPQTYGPWLGVTKSSHAINAGLRQTFSVIAREASIKHLDKTLRSKRWKDIWEALGGTQGLLDILGDLSVNQMKDACTALGRAGKGQDLAQRRECITQLFKGLQPSVYPDAAYKTKDRRPLARHYMRLIPSCTEDLAAQFLGDKGRMTPPLEKQMLRYYPDALRAEQTRALVSGDANAVNQKRLGGVLTLHPQVPGLAGTRFSASMDFALETLRLLVDSDSTTLDDVFFVSGLASPLLSRAMKRKVAWQKIEEIVSLVVQCLQKRPRAAKEVLNNRNGMLQMLARCWSQKPDLFEKHLETLFSFSHSAPSQYDELSKWVEFLRTIPHGHRYAVLRFCFRGLTGLDIDTNDGLRRLKGLLSDVLLLELKPQEALDLFTHLKAVRGDEDLVTSGRTTASTILAFSSIVPYSEMDPGLFHVFLLSRNNELDAARALAAPKIEDYQNKAEIAAAPDQRGLGAKSALYYAVASGDIDLSRDVLDWTKRFLNDPIAVREIHRDWHPQEMIELLSGIPWNITGCNASMIRTRVCAGNAVLKDILSMLCAATRSRSFSLHHWQNTLKLYQRVVKERMDRTKKIKNALSLSDDQIGTILWQDTIEMLLEVERDAHSKLEESLRLDTLRGPLAFCQDSHWDYEIKLQTTDASSYKFLDDLARARDELYQKLRPAAFPAVLTLPKPFPRGLPIQHLVAPWLLVARNLSEVAPYIASRAKAVLFQDPELAMQPMPTDPETKNAIGTFVDSFKSAASLYISFHSACDNDERVRRYQEVWDYAVGDLSQGRMTKEEAERFWRHLSVLPHVDMPKRKEGRPIVCIDKWPVIPEVDDPTQPHEWEIPTPPKLDIRQRGLGALTYLDVSLRVVDRTPKPTTLSSRFGKLPSIVVPSEWKDPDSQEGSEGGVLRGLLHTEAKYGASNGRLLGKPFPSARDARYPSLYIEPESEPEPKSRSSKAVNKFYIKGDLDTFPPSLLLLAARNMVSAYSATDLSDKAKVSQLEPDTFAMIQRVSTSDRPALSKNLVLNAILDYPDAGSWHRDLLAPSYLNCLRPDDTKQLYVSFADAILEKIQQAHERQKQGDVKTKEGRKAEQKPFIKITTIKLLAQLLNKAEFIDEAQAFSILSALINKSTHVDVRLNTAKTLMSMLNTRPADQGESIFKALENVIPVAGNLFERKPVTEASWTKAEETLVLPDCPGVDDEAPLMSALIQHYEKGSGDGERERLYVKCILLPTLDELARQNARWAKLFLVKHGVEAEVPVIPSHYATLLKAGHWRLLPRRIFEDLVTYITFVMTTPIPIAAFNEQLRAAQKARPQPEVQRWLDIYGGGGGALFQLDTFDMFSFLDEETKLDHATGITPDVVHEQFMRLFKALMIEEESPFYHGLDGKLIIRILNGTYLSKPWWSTQGVSLLNAMLTHVKSLRTPEWQRNASRSPSVLPETFPWRLLLLNHPVADTDGEKSKRFAEQLARTLDDMQGSVYHKRLKQLESYLALDPPEPCADDTTSESWKFAINNNRLRVALRLWALSSSSTYDLKIEVAAYLVKLVRENLHVGYLHVEELDGEVVRAVKEMVDAWKESGDEEVRRVGCVIASEISDWVEDKDDARGDEALIVASQVGGGEDVEVERTLDATRRDSF